ncbi:MAG: hypothetical protein IKC72_02150 [Clostridia bacterium]|nr:hypothetical protein [Clostridia bacterium]
METTSFTYQYSAQESREVEAIRKKYLPKEMDKMARLRALDRQVQMAGVVFALSLGIIGVLLFGVAMCFGLGVFEMGVLAIPFGIVGVLFMAPAYPIYKHLHNKKKEALTPEILALSEELMVK